MRHHGPSVPAVVMAASLALAVPVRAAEGPRSGAWGPDYKARIQGMFKKILDASGYDAPAWLKKDGRRPTRLILEEKARFVEKAPALCLPAKWAPNTQDHALVIVSFGMLEALDQDQFAFIVAHEVSHLTGEHAKRIYDSRMKLFEAWHKEKAESLARVPPRDVLARFQRENSAEISAQARGLEREADSDGLNLVQTAGFDREHASTALKRTYGWLLALGIAGGEGAGHDPLLERAKAMSDANRKLDGKAKKP